MRAADLDTLVFTNSTNLEMDPPRADSWEEVVEHELKAREDRLTVGGDHQGVEGTE